MLQNYLAPSYALTILSLPIPSVTIKQLSLSLSVLLPNSRAAKIISFRPAPWIVIISPRPTLQQNWTAILYLSPSSSLSVGTVIPIISLRPTPQWSSISLSALLHNYICIWKNCSFFKTTFLPSNTNSKDLELSRTFIDRSHDRQRPETTPQSIYNAKPNQRLIQLQINPCNNNNLSLMIAPSMKHSVGDFSF